MKLKLKAQVSRSEAQTFRGALKQLERFRWAFIDQSLAEGITFAKRQPVTFLLPFSD